MTQTIDPAANLAALIRSRQLSAEEFALWIRPSVFGCTGDVNGTGSHERDQFMLIHRQLVFPVGILLEIAIEPVRKILRHDGRGLAEVALR